jgi:hypothetical protein
MISEKMIKKNKQEGNSVEMSTFQASVNNISQWIHKYGDNGQQIVHSHLNFLDDFNVMRDSSWAKIDHQIKSPLTVSLISSSSMGDYSLKLIKNVIERTGCIWFKLTLFQSEYADNPKHHKESTNHTNRKVGNQIEKDCYLLSDWQRLWDYFLRDPGDEIAAYAPFLRSCREFFFHEKTALFMYILCLWNCIVFIILQSFFPNAVNFTTANNDFAVNIWGLIIYLFTYYHDRGEIPYWKFIICQTMKIDHIALAHKYDIEQHYHHQQKHQSFHDDIPKMVEHHVHWTGSMKQMYVRAWNEVKTILYPNEQYQLSLAIDTHATNQINYTKWMNIGLKFLVQLNGKHGMQGCFNRRTYQAVLLFVITLYPLYMIILVYQLNGASLVKACYSGSQHDNCAYYQYFVIASCGFSTFVLLQYIYASSVIITLVGLAYGGEIAYRSANSWLQKYGGLRRVSKLDTCYINRYYHLSPPSPESRTETGAKTAGETSTSSQPISLSVSPPLSSSSMMMETKTTDDNNNNNNNNNNNIDISQNYSKKLHDEIGNEIHILEGFSTSSNVLNQSLMSDSDKEKLEIIEKSSEEIVELIKRDAIEQYLFIRQSMNLVGKIWSTVLTGLIILVAYECLADTIFILLNVVDIITFIRIVIFLTIRIIVIIIYPIISIAFANSYLLKIKEIFSVAADEDFQVIGGRDFWLNFLDQFPAVWTCYGLYITPERLMGLIWTTVAAIGSIVFSCLYNL